MFPRRLSNKFEKDIVKHNKLRNLELNPDFADHRLRSLTPVGWFRLRPGAGVSCLQFENIHQFEGNVI